ncbi:MAG: hypothetical protein NC200_08450 [Candidatus Gastranaerophilales bacterium]|nr:hypothetical protein [Candidatus Gastranaerophilales bacterium]
MADLFFIAGIILFPLLLITPLVFIFMLGSHPEWQEKISKSFDKFINNHKKQIIVSLIVLGVLSYIVMGIGAAKEGGLITFIESTIETFAGYFLVAIIFSIFAGVFSKFKK